jgi:predicted DNA-binding protein (UPF0251 family)
MKTLQQTVEETRLLYYARALRLLETTNLTLKEVATKSGVSPRTVFNLATSHGIHRPLGRPKL